MKIRVQAAPPHTPTLRSMIAVGHPPPATESPIPLPASSGAVLASGLPAPRVRGADPVASPLSVTSRRVDGDAGEPQRAEDPGAFDDLDFFGEDAIPLDLGGFPGGHAGVESAAGRALSREPAVRFTPQPMEAVKPPVSAVSPVASGTVERRGPDAPVSTRGETQPVAEAGPPPSRQVIEGVPSLDPRPGVVAFAGFGLVPEKSSELPSYALRVLARRRVLREGLAVARKHRSRDVELYQAAIASADEGAVRKGLVLLAVVTFAGLGIVGSAFQLLI